MTAALDRLARRAVLEADLADATAELAQARALLATVTERAEIAEARVAACESRAVLVEQHTRWLVSRLAKEYVSGEDAVRIREARQLLHVPDVGAATMAWLGNAQRRAAHDADVPRATACECGECAGRKAGR